MYTARCISPTSYLSVVTVPAKILYLNVTLSTRFWADFHTNMLGKNRRSTSRIRWSWALNDIKIIICENWKVILTVKTYDLLQCVNTERTFALAKYCASGLSNPSHPRCFHCCCPHTDRSRKWKGCSCQYRSHGDDLTKFDVLDFAVSRANMVRQCFRKSIGCR